MVSSFSISTKDQRPDQNTSGITFIIVVYLKRPPQVPLSDVLNNDPSAERIECFLEHKLKLEGKLPVKKLVEI